MSEKRVIVIGLGDVGKPLAEFLSTKYRVFTRDVEPLDIPGPIDVMHVCFPFQVEDFVGATVEYIAQYQPALTIIHSTVFPGTTRAVSQGSQRSVSYSAVLGKHASMDEHLRSYTKFVGAVTQEVARASTQHLSDAGMRADSFSSPEALELAKLLETTYLGLLVAWAQEQERYCAKLGVDYEEVTRFFHEIDYLPPVVFQPGFIGGHCVIPNTYLLEQVRPSQFIQAIRHSNDLKRDEWLGAGRGLDEKLAPRRI